MVSLTLILQAALNGLIMGSTYAMIAGGLTIIYGVMDIINLTHGDFLMLAMYATFFLFTYLYIDPFISIVVVTPVLFAFGALCYKVFIKPIAHAPPVNQVLLTFGLSLFLQNLALLFFSADFRTIDLKYGQSTFALGNLVIGMPQLIGFTMATGLSFACYWMLKSTDIGRMIRAASQNREAAALMGINVNKIFLIAFSFGVGLLGIAGPIVSTFFYTAPSVGTMFLVTAFVIVVLGGMGDFLGALLGGFMIGIVESVASVLVPGSQAPAFTMALFIAVLMFRPQGLLGGAK